MDVDNSVVIAGGWERSEWKWKRAQKDKWRWKNKTKFKKKEKNDPQNGGETFTSKCGRQGFPMH